MEVTAHEMSPVVTETNQMLVEGRKLKMSFASHGQGEGGFLIYDGEKREVMIVDHGNKNYTVVDQEAIQRLAGQVSQMMSQLEQALKNVPEAQRPAIEKMMKQRMPKQAPELPPSEVRDTGERASQAGYPCVKYDVLQGGEKLLELWVTDWDNVEGSEQVKELFTELAEFMRQLMEAFTSSAGSAAAFGQGLRDSVFNVVDQLDGFPVVTRQFKGGALGMESTLRKASRKALDAAAFEPPPGYQRRQIFQ
jgi:hypothetical protein